MIIKTIESPYSTYRKCFVEVHMIFGNSPCDDEIHGLQTFYLEPITGCPLEGNANRPIFGNKYLDDKVYEKAIRTAEAYFYKQALQVAA